MKPLKVFGRNQTPVVLQGLVPVSTVVGFTCASLVHFREVLVAYKLSLTSDQLKTYQIRVDSGVLE
jgi:hypothetical protein